MFATHITQQSDWMAVFIDSVNEPMVTIAHKHDVFWVVRQAMRRGEFATGAFRVRSYDVREIGPCCFLGSESRNT
jgi:hypothetical protein